MRLFNRFLSNAQGWHVWMRRIAQYHRQSSGIIEPVNQVQMRSNRNCRGCPDAAGFRALEANNNAAPNNANLLSYTLSKLPHAFVRGREARSSRNLVECWDARRHPCHSFFEFCFEILTDGPGARCGKGLELWGSLVALCSIRAVQYAV
jgi:hypothetical protein